MRKKFFSMFLVVAMVASLAVGCSSSKDTKEETSATVTPKTETPATGTTDTTKATVAPEETSKGGLTIANTPKMVGISWWDRMDAGNQEWAKATGNEVFQLGATVADAAEQVSAIEDAIAQNVDAITVIPYDPDSVEQVLTKAKDQGIVVISHEAAALENKNYDIEAFNNTEYGAHLMDNLAKEMGNEGDYVIIVGSLTMATHQEWAAGAIARQKEAYPNMKLVCDITAPRETSTDSTYQTAKELLTSYPTIKGFIGMDTVNPPGIAMAVEEAGKSGQIAIAGTCLVSVAGEYLKSGTIKNITFWDPAMAGQAMCDLAVKVINGEAITDGISLNTPGFEKCKLDGTVLYGNAWVDVTVDNMGDYNF